MNIGAIIKRLVRFIRYDIWHIRLQDLPGARYFFVKQLRIVLLALREFGEDRCHLRASALTFYSLLSIVPVVAMAFGVAKGFGLEKVLEKQIIKQLSGQEEVATRIIDFARSLLENTKGGLIAGIGVLLLFYTIFKVLANIEHSFNDIWGVKSPRSLGRRLSDYLAIMVVCPLLFVISHSLTVFVMGQLKIISQNGSGLALVSPLLLKILNFLPFGVIWVLFSFIYIFVPNTKVNLKSGILAGIVAGSVYQFVNWGYFKFQVGAANYGAIYGSFAALPLFLIWLQVSWLIVLLGAEICFGHQNVETYELEPLSQRASHSFKKLLALKMTHLLIKNFHQGKKPLTADQISRELDIPSRLVHDVLYELVEAAVLTETTGENLEIVGYQPARCIEHMTIGFVINQLEHRGIESIPIQGSESLSKLSSALRQIHETIARSPGNVPLKDL